MCGKNSAVLQVLRERAEYFNLWGKKLNIVGKIFDEIFISFLQRIVMNISKHV